MVAFLAPSVLLLVQEVDLAALHDREGFAVMLGVLPAQQEARTEMGTSHNRDFKHNALEITQMSVHTPTNSMAS